MNTSVTKSAKKNNAGKTAAKYAAQPKVEPSGQSPVKSTLKTMAGKLTKAIKSALKPIARSAKPAKTTNSGGEVKLIEKAGKVTDNVVLNARVPSFGTRKSTNVANA